MILYQGPKVWNSLPVSITSSTTVMKSLLKLYLHPFFTELMMISMVEKLKCLLEDFLHKIILASHFKPIASGAPFIPLQIFVDTSVNLQTG